MAFLRELPGAKKQLHVMRAELLEDGSFDDAIAGMDGVFHVASPVLVPNWENPEVHTII